MLLAEFEVRHSRPVAPTRRVALGEIWLPTDPAPGFGGILLGAIVAAVVARLDEEERDDLDRLIDDVEHLPRIPQPRLRHRFQTDTQGLDRSTHRLVGEGERVLLDFDDHGPLLAQAAAAVYAAGKLGAQSRAEVFRVIRRATRWAYGNVEGLVGYLTNDEAAYKPWRSAELTEGWALDVLGFIDHDEPSRSQINKRFRELLFLAHPDHGGDPDDAAQRITDLTEAKRILLAEPC